MNKKEIILIAEKFGMVKCPCKQPYYMLDKGAWQIDFGVTDLNELYYGLIFESETMDEFNREHTFPLNAESVEVAIRRIKGLLRIADDHSLLAELLTDIES